MAIDVGRVLHAAIEAATQQTSTDGRAKKRNSHLSGGRAVLLGAALVTVGRLAAPKGREMLDSVQDRLEELASDLDEREHGANRNYEGEPEAQTDEDFDEEEFDATPEVGGSPAMAGGSE